MSMTEHNTNTELFNSQLNSVVNKGNEQAKRHAEIISHELDLMAFDPRMVSAASTIQQHMRELLKLRDQGNAQAVKFLNDYHSRDDTRPMIQLVEMDTKQNKAAAHKHRIN